MHLQVARRVNHFLGWTAAVVALSAGALANAPSVSPALTKSPNIVVITLDTTRADRMGFLGSKRGLTPNLDLLARQSSVFLRAYSQVPLTPPSHATIFTGTYPQFHHVSNMQTPLAADLPYTPEILHAQGYHTAAFVASIVLSPKPPFAVGFDRGFDTYDADFHQEEPAKDRYEKDRYKTVVRRGGEVVAHALTWLNKHPKGPFFIWVHLYDAHDPYDPPEPYKTRYRKDPYDGGIAYEDAVVGRLIRQLKLRGLYDQTVVAVMADHGESLGAHGEETHGVFLYDETIQVPLLIKLPGAQTEKRIENRVELVDISPTLLEEAGVAIPKEMQGVSLLSLMTPRPENDRSAPDSENWRERPAYSESEYPHLYGWSALRSIRAEKYLYIQAPRRELYDQTADPKAEHNLQASSPAIADTLASQLQALRKRTTSAREAPISGLDAAAQAKLGALGYMASSASISKSNPDEGPDPKDKIEIANLAHRAEILEWEMRTDESAALLEQVIALNPTSQLYLNLGTLLMRKHDFQKAVPALRKALEMDPENDGTRFMLGKSLLATQDYQGTIPVLEALIAKVPDAVEAHSFLELAYAQTNRPSDAIKECNIVLQYNPDDPGSYLILGQSLARTGDPEAGIAALKKAASINPADPTPHSWLADIYTKVGRPADAERERAEAKHLSTSEE
jgi:arylsulfatase A-like enzyme/cytochrome c-type biogenesis protein CcmH/NrfG